MPKKEELLDYPQALEVLGISLPTLHRLINKGELRRFKKPFGNRRAFVSAEDVKRIMQPIEEVEEE